MQINEISKYIIQICIMKQASHFSTTEYQASKISDLRYYNQDGSRSVFVLTNSTIKNVKYDRVEFQLTDDLEELHRNNVFLAKVIRAKPSQGERGSNLIINQNYLMIKTPPRTLSKELIEKWCSSVFDSSDDFIIRDRKDEKNYRYSLKFIKIDELTTDVAMTENETYLNVYLQVKKICRSQCKESKERKDRREFQKNILVMTYFKWYYINNDEITKQKLGLKCNQQNLNSLNNIFGIMKLLLKKVDQKPERLPQIDVQRINLYSSAIDNQTFQEHAKTYLTIFNNCIKAVNKCEELKYSPVQTGCELSSMFSLQQMPTHPIYACRVNQYAFTTSIFTDFRPNYIHTLKADPLEFWHQDEIFCNQSDLLKREEMLKDQVQQKQNQRGISQKPKDYFLINSPNKLLTYNFSSLYADSSELKSIRIVWVDTQLQEVSNRVKISSMVTQFRYFENLRELGLISCHLQGLPVLHSSSKHHEGGLVGLRSLKGLFLDRNCIKEVKTEGKGDVYGQLELLSLNRNPVQACFLQGLPSLRLLRIELTSSLMIKDHTKKRPLIQSWLPLPAAVAQSIGYKYYLPRILPSLYSRPDNQILKVYSLAAQLIRRGYQLYYRVEAFCQVANPNTEAYRIVAMQNWRHSETDILQRLEQAKAKNQANERNIKTQKKRASQMKKQEIKASKIKKQQYQDYDPEFSYSLPEEEHHYPPEQPEKVHIIKKYQYVKNSKGHFPVGDKDRVLFPYQKPYTIQLRIINEILTRLDNGQNFMIQAPTGCGKTISILTGVLGWVETDNRRKQHILDERKELWKKGEKIDWKTIDMSGRQPINKIIYMSRSHTQIEQVSDELGKTCYEPDVVAVGSKLKLCAHETVSQILEGNKLQSACKRAISSAELLRKLKNMTLQQQMSDPLFSNEQELKALFNQLQKQQCKYYKSFKDRFKLNKRVFLDLSGKQTTIELEKVASMNQETCPYFYPSTGKYYCNLILMPYIYILNKSRLKYNEKYITNSILIFDEGHNILSQAEEGSSLTLTSTLFSKVLYHLKKPKDKPKQSLFFDSDLYEEMMVKEATIKQNQAEDNQPQISNKGKSKQRNFPALQLLQNFNSKYQKYMQHKIKQLQAIAKNKQRSHLTTQPPSNLEQFEQEDEGSAETHTSFQKKQQQDEMPDFMERVQFIPAENIKSEIIKMFTGEVIRQRNLLPVAFDKFQADCQNLCKNLQRMQLQQAQNKNEDKKTPSFLTSCARLKGIIQQMFQILMDRNLDPDYGLFLHSKSTSSEAEEQPEDKQGGEKKRSLQIKLHCFNSAKMFEKIKALRPKSIIIASGTLIPPNNWEPYTSLGLFCKKMTPFQEFNLQQLMTVNVSKYEGTSLKLLSKHPEFYQNVQLALKTVNLICSATPNGVLVVVSSKKWMTQIKKILQEARIEKIHGKIIRYEDKKETKNLNQFVQSFRSQCMKEGAVLFAICKGSLSEGINFKHELCRALVIIGVPLLPIDDVYIKAKMAYRDRKRELDRRNKIELKDSVQSGSEWCHGEVVRSVNQAIGRVIRDIDDFGVIYLVDQRYSRNGKYFKDLSEWATKPEVFKNQVDASQITQLSKEFFQRQQDRIANRAIVNKQSRVKMQPA